jgi:hypothetical protein
LIIREKYQNRWAHPSAARSEPRTDCVRTAPTTSGHNRHRLPCSRLPVAVSPPRFHRRAALRPSPLSAIKGAQPRKGPFLLPPPSASHCVVMPPLWNHRAAPPRPLRTPSRPVPELRCSAAQLPDPVASLLDPRFVLQPPFLRQPKRRRGQLRRAPSDIFLASNRSTTPPPCHNACSPPTFGAGLPKFPNAASAAVAERRPLFPSRWATSQLG